MGDKMFPLTHTCYRDDGGTPNRRCQACEEEKTSVSDSGRQIGDGNAGYGNEVGTWDKREGRYIKLDPGPASSQGDGYAEPDTYGLLSTDVFNALRNAPAFTVKDSGARKQFASGMVRDTSEGKTDFTRVLDGPMLKRWAQHLTRAEVKYPDVSPGVANWLLAEGDEELQRFRKSAFRHFVSWLLGEEDEDHASATFFNINGAEYVKEKMRKLKDAA